MKRLLCAGTILLLVGLAAGAAASDPLAPADRTRAALESGRRYAKTPPELEKLDSGLAQLAAASGQAGLAALVSQQSIELVAEDRVRVVIEVEPDGVQAALECVARFGGAVELHHAGLIQATVPITVLAHLAREPTLLRVRLPIPVEPYEDSIASQGVPLIGADMWHDAGWSGHGARVGIIDEGFAGYRAFLGSELPLSVTTRWSLYEGASAHGTACAEIVHDVAPGAQLYLARLETEVGFGVAVDWMIAHEVDVISFSMGYLNTAGPGDGTGWVNARVAEAHRAGITFVVSAGNFARRHWSGTWHDPEDTGLLHFADGDVSNAILASEGDVITVGLRWDDPWGASNNDYDLHLFYGGVGSWYQVAHSSNWQTGTQNPTESITYRVPPGAGGWYHVVVSRHDADATSRFSLQSMRHELQHRVSEGSMSIPADSPHAVSVGAVAWDRPDALALYSSQGPTTDGRIKPDLVAPSGVRVASYSAPFHGTSASAPHVAGAVALLRERYPGMEHTQLCAWLARHAVPLGEQEKNNAFGAGRLSLGVPEAPIALTTPGCDAIAMALEQLGHRYSLVGLEALGDYDAMRAYTSLFVNSSHAIAGIAVDAAPVLERFVREGGVAYVSGSAYVLLEQAFPGQIAFAGHTGRPEDVSGMILDPGMAAYLGHSNVELSFDEAPWVPVDAVSPGVRVFAEGGANLGGGRSRPLVVAFRHGKGTVFYTSFHHALPGSLGARLLEYVALAVISQPLASQLGDAMTEAGYDVVRDVRAVIRSAEDYALAHEVQDGQRLMVGVHWPSHEGVVMRLSILGLDGTLLGEVQGTDPPLLVPIADVADARQYVVSAADVPQRAVEYVMAIGQRECVQERRTRVFPRGWNLISPPLVPSTPEPAALFSELPHLHLYHWDPTVGGNWRTMANGLLAELSVSAGYWLWLEHPVAIEVSGEELTGRRVVRPLGSAGWKMIGVPYPVSWGSGEDGAILLQLDGVTKRLAEAVVAGWVYNMIWDWDAAEQQWATHTAADGVTLDPWHGYWIWAARDDLELIFHPSGDPPDLPTVPTAPAALESWELSDPPLPMSPTSISGERLAVSAFPNPVRDEAGVTFVVLEPPPVYVEAMRVRVLDLGGHTVWQGETQGPQLAWGLRDPSGRVMANGVYIYTVEVKFAGAWMWPAANKLLILR